MRKPSRIYASFALRTITIVQAIIHLKLVEARMRIVEHMKLHE